MRRDKHMVQKIYRKLTKDQRERNVVFSSTLSIYRTELLNDIVHEVLESTENKWEIINRLRNDKFFNGSHFKYNIIRK